MSWLSVAGLPWIKYSYAHRSKARASSLPSKWVPWHPVIHSMGATRAAYPGCSPIPF